jgi:dTDP-4-amino-4,6-dideoxygalactose transaminase
MDLGRIHRELEPQILDEIQATIRRGDFILGDAVKQFEEDYARYHGSAFAIGCGNGLDAMSMVLQALNIGPGDEVITTTHTFIATVFSITQAGARPVLVDCRPDDLLIDMDQVRQAITPRTKALAVVHLYGRLADMSAVASVADDLGLPVIEDAAQAHGAQRDGRLAGSYGRAGSFSFYPSKNLGALGDAGMVVTDDAALAGRLRSIRTYGCTQKYYHDELGRNSRMDTLHAVVLRVKLRFLDEWNRQRQQAAAYYTQQLSSVVDIPSQPRAGGDGRDHVHHLYVIRVEDRDGVARRLRERGIDTGIHYPTPVHLQPCYRSLGYKEGDFPVSEEASKRLLSLPMFPGITRAEQDEVIDAVRQCAT